MPYKDLREYIDTLEKEGEVQRIRKEVDWDLEAGAIIRRSYEIKAPAPFFEKLKDYPESYKIFGAPMASSNKPNHYYVRMAQAMGMNPESSAQDIIEEYIKQVASSLWATQVGSFMCIYVVIVEDDVDVTNMDEVLWAITTRCHPNRGIHKVPIATCNPLVPFTSPYEKEHLLGANVIFDCTWPKDWPKEAIPVKASFDVLWPEEIQQRVLKNWKEYGYQE